MPIKTCGGRTVDESMRLTGAGNLLVGGTVQDASAQGVLHLYTVQAPAAHVDNSIQIYSDDTSDATATLALMLEQAVAAIGTFTADYKLRIKINGDLYDVALDKV